MKMYDFPMTALLEPACACRAAGKSGSPFYPGTAEDFTPEECSVMSSLMTIKGYVTPVPRAADPRQARVAVRQQDDEEYRIIPRGAGVDLDGEVSVPVEVTGIVDELDGVRYLMVRGYKVLEDDTWID